MRWQAALEREGLVKGDRVAVMPRNNREWAAFDLVRHTRNIEKKPENEKVVVLQFIS